MPRSLISAQNMVDQSQYTGTSSVGFGNFNNASNPRYRGQVFVPTQSTLAAIGFWLVDPPNGGDMAVYLTDVDQSAQTPINSPLAQWIIPVANLVQGKLTVYPLSPVYTGLTIGHKYAFYLAPFSGGVYTDNYRGVAMQTGSQAYASGKEITNKQGVWSTENISWNFVTCYPAVRSKVTGRSTVTGRTKIS